MAQVRIQVGRRANTDRLLAAGSGREYAVNPQHNDRYGGGVEVARPGAVALCLRRSPEQSTWPCSCCSTVAPSSAPTRRGLCWHNPSSVHAIQDPRLPGTPCTCVHSGLNQRHSLHLAHRQSHPSRMSAPEPSRTFQDEASTPPPGTFPMSQRANLTGRCEVNSISVGEHIASSPKTKYRSSAREGLINFRRVALIGSESSRCPLAGSGFHPKY